jgi:hypothetical protein
MLRGTMNSKIVLAFFAGAVLASGIVYMAVRNEPVAKPSRLASAPVKPIYINPEPASESPGNSSAARAATARPEATELPGEPPIGRPARKAKPEPTKSERVKYEKPSPLPPPQRKEQVAQVLRPAEPVSRPETAPLKEPINKERPLNDANIGPPPASTPPPPPPAPAPEAPKESAPSQPPAPEVTQPHTVTITAGTILPVRIGETITADHNQPGDTFLATLDKPLIVDGFVIAERGARLEGRIVEAERAGRVKGLSHLAVELVKLSTADGQHVRIRTASFQKESQASTGSDAAKVGIGAAIGAAIGGMAGGGKGAGIGAGVGGAAGAGDVLLTRGKAASIPVETRISFRLQEPVTITERLQ